MMQHQQQRRRSTLVSPGSSSFLLQADQASFAFPILRPNDIISCLVELGFDRDVVGSKDDLFVDNGSSGGNPQRARVRKIFLELVSVFFLAHPLRASVVIL